MCIMRCGSSSLKPAVKRKFGEYPSLLKNSLYARFGPRSGPKHTIFGASWSFWSPIGSHFRLGADFFNRLTLSTNSGVQGTEGLP
jgi:hypothetical protein